MLSCCIDINIWNRVWYLEKKIILGTGQLASHWILSTRRERGLALLLIAPQIFWICSGPQFSLEQMGVCTTNTLWCGVTCPSDAICFIRSFDYLLFLCCIYSCSSIINYGHKCTCTDISPSRTKVCTWLLHGTHVIPESEYKLQYWAAESDTIRQKSSKKKYFYFGFLIMLTWP